MPVVSTLYTSQRPQGSHVMRGKSGGNDWILLPWWWYSNGPTDTLGANLSNSF